MPLMPSLSPLPLCTSGRAMPAIPLPQLSSARSRSRAQQGPCRPAMAPQHILQARKTQSSCSQLKSSSRWAACQTAQSCPRQLADYSVGAQRETNDHVGDSCCLIQAVRELKVHDLSIFRQCVPCHRSRTSCGAALKTNLVALQAANVFHAQGLYRAISFVQRT